MKMRLPSIARLLAALSLTVSPACSQRLERDEAITEAGSFDATIELDTPTKTLLTPLSGNSRSVLWQNGDRVLVGGKSYIASGIYDGGNRAVLVGEGASPEGGVYKAWYPESIYSKDGSNETITLPAVQSYLGTSGENIIVSHLPMYAESSTTSLNFRNLCSVLEIKLSGTSTEVVGSIEVESTDGKKLSGKVASISWNNGAPILTMDSSASGKVTMDCGTAGVPLSAEPTSILVAIPAQDYAAGAFKVTVRAPSGSILSILTLSADFTAQRSTVHEVVKAVGHVAPLDMKISTSESLGRTFRMPFRGNDVMLPTTLMVDWGDGTCDIFPAGTSAAEVAHTYADSADGDHVIRISAITEEGYEGEVLPYFSFSQDSSAAMLKEVLTSLPKVSSISGMFRDCINLTSIPGDLFVNNPQVTSAGSVFCNCHSLSGIPEGLFDNNPNITSFQYTFWNCYALSGSIPEGLFDNNPLAAYFYGTFYRCRNLTGPIPEGLFDNQPDAKEFAYTFDGCNNLTGSIPDGLFDNNPKVTTFFSIFNGCRSLTGPIPEGLFDNQPNVKEFYYTFQGCRNLTGPIPAGLFDNQLDVTSFHCTFSGCSNLTGSIPDGLFDKHPNVTDFAWTFQGCSSLTSIPSGLFDNNPKVTTFERTFDSCSSLTGIPAGLFDNNPEVTSFFCTFMSCSGLTDPIPAGLFDNNPKVTTFRSIFCDCSNLTGSIPEGFFDNNTLVTTFGWTFANCHGLTGVIPEDLFANHPLVTDFYATFKDCRGLQIVDDIFVKDGVNDKTNRFESVSKIDFRYCFQSLGYNHSSAGTAPELWDYTLPGDIQVYGCYYNTWSKYTNRSSIPYDWRKYSN